MYQEENNYTVSPIILIITGVAALVLIVMFFVQVYDARKIKNAFIDDLKLSYDTSEWSKCKIVSVNYYDNRIVEYSFDGGINWIVDNTYSLCENKTLSVKVRNNKGKEIGSDTIDVNMIDSITPTIILKDITINVGSKFDLLSDVIAVDNESGISGNITYSPKTIDTSKVGEYIISYKVYDKAGNYTIKDRLISVK